MVRGTQSSDPHATPSPLPAPFIIHGRVNKKIVERNVYLPLPLWFLVPQVHNTSFGDSIITRIFNEINSHAKTIFLVTSVLTLT